MYLLLILLKLCLLLSYELSAMILLLELLVHLLQLLYVVYLSCFLVPHPLELVKFMS
jgi:hypothetical protein